MELYFTKPQNITADRAEFDSFESHHLIKTMRKKTGNSIFFTDGCGNLYEGNIISLQPVIKVKHQLVRSEKESIEGPVLGVGFIRHNRLDFMIEKVTELGVDKIFLFHSQNANYFTSNGLRWNKIARQAIKQSQRLFLPEIYTLPDFQQFLSEVSTYSTKFILNQNADFFLKENIHNIPDKISDAVCIIGPEGGFDKNEITQAEQYGCKSVTLGKHRLRTETAAIAAVSILSFSRN
jgi:16S rRNA (uracil1498-N3)-methyltransferase